LLTAGLVGFIPYLWSWIAGWGLFARLWRCRDQFSRERVRELGACGAVMAFLTLRAIPETTGASYEPDLLILCAVYAYLEAVDAGDPGRGRPVRVLLGQPDAQKSAVYA
jgi:peptidoglycan/LPS O-acetylase OafA/YrhL